MRRTIQRIAEVPLAAEALLLAVAALTMMAVLGNPFAFAAGLPQVEAQVASGPIGPGGGSASRLGIKATFASETVSVPLIAIARRVERCASY